jgi:DNA-binding transcriptional LysR family regulator
MFSKCCSPLDSCIFFFSYQLAKIAYSHPILNGNDGEAMKNQLNWDDLQLFLSVAEEGSLSAAARSLKLGQPTLSRRIQALETQVGEPLFDRLSIGSPLTLAGQRLLPAAQRMAEWAIEAQASLNQEPFHRLQGKVRIATPPGVATEFLLPLVAALRHSHPKIHVQILAGVETLNLSRGEADLSVRLQKPTSADLDVLDSLTSQVCVYAAPQYASQFTGNIKAEQLDWIAWAPPYEHLPLNAELQRLMPGTQHVFTSDDFLVLLAACRAGVGVLPLARAMIRNETMQGLVPIAVDGFPNMVSELFLVAHKRHRHLAKLLPVINLIRSEFESWRRSKHFCAS